MLTEDAETQASLAALIGEARNAKKPFLFWVGAGVSRWCGYPGWEDFADGLHSEYSRTIPQYDKAKASAFLKSANYPALFQLCHEAHRQTYFRRLADAFAVREPGSVYERFISTLSVIHPVRVVTTNIDEMLERQLPAAITIGKSDLERTSDLMFGSSSFVCKTHGTVSAIETAVFRTSDYDELLASSAWLTALSRLLAQVSVVFVGYGLRDQYVLDILARNCELKALFGDGPHFAVLSSGATVVLPENVRVIHYTATPHTDHRTAISVIDELRMVSRTAAAEANDPTHRQQAVVNLRSAHLLFDVMSEGTWHSSQTVEVQDNGGQRRELIIGPGFNDMELPVREATAMHDLIVGLLCFDTVVFSIHILGKVHNLVGSDRFWRLFDEGVFEFINWSHQPVIIYADPKAISGGSLGSIVAHDRDMKLKGTADAIRRQLTPVPGNEATAERQLLRLESKTMTITDEQEASIPSVVRSLLLRPSVRVLLGMSEGTPTNSIPRWQTFPVLRLAQVARIGTACRLLGIPSTKLDFGTSALAAPVFASVPGKEWADDVASYVVCGTFAADVGASVLRDPQILESVLTFRESVVGRSLRSEIFSRLAANEGADVPVAVNSALSAAIPSSVLQSARDEFLRLSAPRGAAETSRVVLWTDKRAEEAVAAWRGRSKTILDHWQRELNLGPYSNCPCGSGEKLRFCCAAALSP